MQHLPFIVHLAIVDPAYYFQDVPAVRSFIPGNSYVVPALRCEIILPCRTGDGQFPYYTLNATVTLEQEQQNVLPADLARLLFFIRKF